MTHQSIYATLTNLCEVLVQSNTVSSRLERGEKHSLIKKLRANAFAVLLKKKCLSSSALCLAEERLDVLVRLRMRALMLHLTGLQKQAERLHCCVDRLLGNDCASDQDFVASLQFLLAYVEEGTQETCVTQDSLQNYLDEFKLPYNKSYSNVRPYRDFSPDVFIAHLDLLEQTQQQANYASYQFLPAGGRFPFSAEPGTDLPLLGRFIRKQRVEAHRYAAVSSPESAFSIPELSSPRGLQIPKLTASPQDLTKDEGYGTPSQEYADLEESDRCYDRAVDPVDTDVWDHVLSPTTCDLRTWECVGELCPDKEAGFLMEVSALDLRHVYMTQVLDQLQSGVNAATFATGQPRYLQRSQVVSHLKYLAAGIESTTFFFNQDKEMFELDAGVCMEGMAPLTFSLLCEDFLACGTLCRKLHDLVCVDKPTRGLVYQAACRSARSFLVLYRHTVLSSQASSLVQLRVLLDTYCLQLACVRDTLHAGPGAGPLLAHLCQQLRGTSRPDITCLLSSLLLACCRAYFSFIEKWIFEGACSDTYGEFFIQAVPEWQGCSSRSYWSRGFCVDEDEVPTFLHGLQDSILQCAKTVALLKRCSPKEPLCVAGERSRPQVLCYVTKDGLARLEVQFQQYESACRLLCGEPVSVSQLLQHSDLDLNAIHEAMRSRLLSAQRERERQIAAQRDKKRLLLEEQTQHLERVRAHKQRTQQEQEEKDNVLLEKHQLEEQRLLQLERKALVEHYNALTEEVEDRIKTAEVKIENARELPDNVKRGLDLGIVLPSPNNNTQENILNIANIAHTTSREDTHTDDVLNNAIIMTPNGNVHLPDLNSNSMTIARHTESIDNANAGVDLICHKLESCGAQPAVSNININAVGMEHSASSRTRRNRVVPDNLPLGRVVSSRPEQSEAQRNKRKILYEEFGMADGEKSETEAFQRRKTYMTDNTGAESELERNRNRVLQSNIGIGVCMREVHSRNFSPDTAGSTPVTPQCEAHVTADASDSPCLEADVTVSGDPSASCDSDVLTNVKSEAALTDESTSYCAGVELHDDAGAIVDSSPSHIRRERQKLEMLFEELPAVVDIADGVLGERKPETLGQESTDVFFLLSALRQSVSVPLRVQMQLANCQVLRLLLVQGDLLSHLHSLHRFFFLLDGEFCRSMSRDLFERLYRTQRPSDLLNVATLSAVLSKALCTSSTPNGDHLSFRINMVPEVLKHASPSVLGSLSLHYHVSWPLNIIITDASLEKYNVVFGFLLKLRRLSWVMEQDFHWLKNVVLTGQIDRAALLASFQYHRLHLWRHHMMQVVCALQGYLLGAIQHESWAQFQRALQHAHTLDQLYQLHALYVREVLHRCFLDAKSQSMETALQNLCRVVLKFHGVLRGRQWVRKPGERAYKHAAFDRLGETYRSFQHLCSFVYRLLVKIATRGYQTHVFCLLQALNMNGYYGDDNQVEHGGDP